MSKQVREARKRLLATGVPGFDVPMFEFSNAIRTVEVAEILSEFRLPFPAVCQVRAHDDGITEFYAVADTTLEQFGLLSLRKLTVSLVWDTAGMLIIDALMGNVEAIKAYILKLQGRPIVQESLNDYLDTDPTSLVTSVLGVSYADKGKLRTYTDEERVNGDPDRTRRINNLVADALRNVLVNFSLLLSPRSVVVENSPVVQRKKAKLGSCKQKTYTILDMTQVRKLFLGPKSKETEEESRAITKGLRRGCYHILKHERFGRNPDGSFVRKWWKSCWVGPKEATVGDRHYRVLLDLDRRPGDAPCEEVE